tara:strand:- start:2984 stop:3577 length:594 start_codon:yes stop_codon:yes gene_type:complete
LKKYTYLIQTHFGIKNNMNKIRFFRGVLLLFLWSSILGNEIWEKEIPPSHYLQSYALKNQESSSKGRKYLSYGSFLGGIVLGSVHTYTEAQIGAGLITIGGLIGIIYDLTTDHETIAFKEYKKIKDIQDKNQKEKLSYEALVFLAKKSTELRKANTNSSGNLIGNIAGIIITNKLNEVLLTPEEKLLNNYLDQKSIK